MSAPAKKPVNLSVRRDLIEEARAAGFNLSKSFEEKLEADLREVRQARFLDENRAAIDAYNRKVEEHGLFSDKYRTFMRKT